jgi:hypothetical protein
MHGIERDEPNAIALRHCAVPIAVPNIPVAVPAMPGPRGLVFLWRVHATCDFAVPSSLWHDRNCRLAFGWVNSIANWPGWREKTAYSISRGFARSVLSTDDSPVRFRLALLILYVRSSHESNLAPR